MQWIIENLIELIISAVIGAIVTFVLIIRFEPVIRKYLLRNRFYPVVGNSNGSEFDTHIVVPSKEGVLESIDPNENTIRKLRNHVRVEDMLAVNLITRTLNLAGVKEEKIHVHTVGEFEKAKQSNNDILGQHLILVGASHKNSFVSMALDTLNAGKEEKILFRKEAENSRTKLIWRNLVSSTSDYLPKNIDEDCKAISMAENQDDEDIGIVLKTVNPYSINKENPSTLMIVAGTRGFGTWGAAKTMRESDKQISKKNGKSGYVLLSNVTSRGTGLQISNRISILEPYNE